VLAAVLRGARVARVTAALAAAMDGFPGGVRIPFIGRRTLGCVLGTRAQRGDHGESVPRGRRAGEEGADPWGRAVSGVGERTRARATCAVEWAAREPSS